ncbi:ubiquitin carboxyl-terminal hydrolase 15-like [Ischnura elegans]|uniref:ubiquitin carboxyl-terminal hydrolase 15-like n=1 Tax=Ischnura elegans TaxID=197161 RepID=UPI001ED8B8C7|nr:ubiquitin carboxyl-terminal hydrolase 15-like [Ischnura elegans]
MANQVEDESTTEDKKKEITPLLSKKMSKGQTWYLVSQEWWRKFQHYIGMVNDEDGVRSCVLPGNIDNSSLLNENGDLKPNLMDKYDYELVPSEAWDLLVEWFGKVPGQDPLKRKVVELGETKMPLVEVYPVQVKVCKTFESDNFKSLQFSSSDTIGKMKKEIIQVFNIPEGVETKLWNSFTPGVPTQCEALDKMDKTIQEVGISQGQTIVVETPTAKGTWSTTPYRDHNGHPYFGLSERRQTAQPGLCGLTNLGNTCFMNSVLQCMSNCPPITDYFINAEHHRELNVDNPIGMGGEIAKAYGDLVQNMWSGRLPSISPHQFKTQVGRFAPQFSGYQQHDSQELLTFLLDGLHEDLNRIKDKPYIEQRDEDDLPDEELAKISWENYLKRNDSIIVDFFHGLLKSTVVCPDCDKISVTFDPFCYLSLPLPQKREKIMEVILIPDDPLRKPVRYKLSVPKRGLVKDICYALHEWTGIPKEKMFVTQVVRHHFHRILSLNDLIVTIDDEDIYIYELPVSYTQNDGKAVAVCLWQSDNVSGPNKLFGIPLVIWIPNKKCSYEYLYKAILNRMQRFVTVPKLCSDLNEDEINTGLYYSYDEGDDCDQVKQCQLFSIHLLSNGSQRTTELEPNGKPLDFSNFQGDQYIAIRWSAKNRTSYFKDTAAIEIENEPIRHHRYGRLQLKECLELYTTIEKLGADDAWYCPRCKKHQRATKKFDLWTLPRILIIQLKRFSYNRCRRDKLDTLVEFPIQGLDMTKYVINGNSSPAIYDLFAVCNHYGAMGGGHYTAYAKNKLDEKWHCFDDNSVSYTSKDNVVSPAAYVLFYMQRDMNNTGLNRMINSGSLAAYGNNKCSDEGME